MPCAMSAGMNLWDKKQVTISGERIAKVDRVASQVQFWRRKDIYLLVAATPYVAVILYVLSTHLDPRPPPPYRWQSS